MSTEGFTMKPKEKSRREILLRIVIATVAVYVGIAIGFGAFSPYSYTRRQQNFAHSLGTLLLQPIMEVLADGMISHPWDWQAFDANRLDERAPGLQVISKSSIRNFNADFDLSNLWIDLGGSKEAAIIGPATNYSGYWSLVFCWYEASSLKCKQGSVMFKNQVKIIVDGNGPVWGMDEKGNLIPLKNFGYVKRWERRDLLLV
jgi:hypothetical protein